VTDDEVDEIVAITQLLARYGHAIDAAKFQPVDAPAQQALDAVFTTDATFDARPVDLGVHAGLDEIRAFFARPKPLHPPSHQTTNVHVSLDGDRAHVASKWNIIDWGGNPVVGSYTDTVVRTPDGWRIAERVVRHLGGRYGALRAPVDTAAVLAIHALKARYFRTLDSKDWDGFAAVFTDDAEMDMRDAAGTVPDGALLAGAATIARAVSRFLDGVQSVHHGHGPEIEVRPDGVATGIWAMEDRMWRTVDGVARYEHGYGHYHETYRLTGDGWRIASTRLTRIRVDDRPVG
jgi:hypothetical protein